MLNATDMIFIGFMAAALHFIVLSAVDKINAKADGLQRRLAVVAEEIGAGAQGFKFLLEKGDLLVDEVRELVALRTEYEELQKNRLKEAFESSVELRKSMEKEAQEAVDNKIAAELRRSEHMITVNL